MHHSVLSLRFIELNYNILY